jgi:hypothetical protein
VPGGGGYSKGPDFLPFKTSARIVSNTVFLNVNVEFVIIHGTLCSYL